MNTKISKLLNNQGGNYILPFFWQHGEDEATLRHYMEVINNCSIGAVCVESRPHPDYCGEQWWYDLDIILDEAKMRNMKVWILDDSHFPTGYANGALKNKSLELRRQFVTYKVLQTVSAGEKLSITIEQYQHPNPHQKTRIEEFILKDLETFDDDQLLGIVAVRLKGEKSEDIVLLPIHHDLCEWEVPAGEWTIYALHLTRNRGPHRDYINMISKDSCRQLIEAVYEPHYARYKTEFGKTIVGFFSDEPELGNGNLYLKDKTLAEIDDQPWSDELETELKGRWGEDYTKYLSLIWDENFGFELTTKIRYDYMDAVTRLVEQNFSYQIGDWCRERGVEYIGHLIEDNNQHTRTASSLGHFFRGLAGQDMAGIDNIGGQVIPQGEDLEMTSSTGTNRDGTFYHFALGKLGASAAAIEPLKRGRAMCENFGNYGWEAGVTLMKYLADHFMVRGINHFVPHAFSPKAFPDPDCPPHFYAHGHNPQYRHFDQLMRYMNRVCELINDGRPIIPVAILYHAEADWTTGEGMYCQVPARILAERQIDYHFIPTDVFVEDKYLTEINKTLKVNTQEYRVLVVPETDFVTAEFAQAVEKMLAKDFPVIFINKRPKGVAGGTVVSFDDLINAIDWVAEIKLQPADAGIRCLHYQNENEIFYLFNEGAKKYVGEITVPAIGSCYVYNAWYNVLETVEAKCDGDTTTLKLSLEPSKSLIVIFDESTTDLRSPIKSEGTVTILNDDWQRTVCSGIDYPEFTSEKIVNLPDTIERENPQFAGFVRYKKVVNLLNVKQVILEINDTTEGIEVFVNGISAGIQIVPNYIFDITSLVKVGDNKIVIEVATTLERAVEKRALPGRPAPEPTNKCGITGNVKLWIKE